MLKVSEFELEIKDKCLQTIRVITKSMLKSAIIRLLHQTDNEQQIWKLYFI